jgi:hypothetical protein
MIDDEEFEKLFLSKERIKELETLKRNGGKKPSTRKPKKGIQFYKFPSAVMEMLARSKYGPATSVATAVYKKWYEDYGNRKRNPVKLTSALLRECGISKDQKLRALKILEQSSWFSVKCSKGRNPLVTMKWLPTEE